MFTSLLLKPTDDLLAMGPACRSPVDFLHPDALVSSLLKPTDDLPAVGPAGQAAGPLPRPLSSSSGHGCPSWTLGTLRAPVPGQPLSPRGVLLREFSAPYGFPLFEMFLKCPL